MSEVEYLVKTNYGVTYRWTAEQIAEDYASTAIQWQGEDAIAPIKTQEELYKDILQVPEWLRQWFYDYIHGDITYSIEKAELVEVNQNAYDAFVRRCLHSEGFAI